jgi:hypothetical protein
LTLLPSTATEDSVHLTRADVVKIIRDFLDGTGGAHDWDDFLSLKLDDPELEKIRLFAVISQTDILNIPRNLVAIASASIAAPRGLQSSGGS